MIYKELIELLLKEYNLNYKLSSKLCVTEYKKLYFNLKTILNIN